MLQYNITGNATGSKEASHFYKGSVYKYYTPNVREFGDFGIIV